MYTCLEKLKRGVIFNVGKFKFYDDGVELENFNFFHKNDRKFFRWNEVKLSSQNGDFVISSKDGEFNAEASYLYEYNTHIWETLIRNMFKHFNSNNLRLSNLLNVK